MSEDKELAVNIRGTKIFKRKRAADKRKESKTEKLVREANAAAKKRREEKKKGKKKPGFLEVLGFTNKDKGS